MREALKQRLKECGLDVQAVAESPVLARLPQVGRAVYVCRDNEGAITLTGVPETEWHFEGTICLAGRVLLLIDEKVASE